VAVGVILFDALSEFALAIGTLAFGLLAFAVQISDWKPTDNRYVTLKKLIYGLAVAGVLIFLGIIFMKRKGEKQWSNIDAINTLMASAGKAAAFTYNNVPWRFVFTAAIACVLTWLTARAWFVTRSPDKRHDGSPDSRQQIVTADSLRGCQDEWLHDKLKEDKSWIKDLVRFPGIIYFPDFQKAQIDFGFSVFNNSLCDIVIENSVSGEIHYGEDNDTFYYPPKFLSDTPIKCASRSGVYFVIRQAIRQEEISRFRDAENVLIWFYDLQINFHGTERFPEIGTTPFDTNHHVETKKRIWRDWDRLEFVFGYTEEQWTLLKSMPRAELTKPETETPALPPAAPKEEPKELEPNLVCLRRETVSCSRSGPASLFVEGPYDVSLPRETLLYKAHVAVIDNRTISSRKIGPARDVTARIVYPLPGIGDFEVPRGAWLSESDSKVTFWPSRSHRLILAVVPDEGPFVIHGVELKHSSTYGLTAEAVSLNTKEIAVDVILESGGAVLCQFKFLIIWDDSGWFTSKFVEA